VHKVLRKKLKLHAYKIQLLDEIKVAGKPKRKEFAEHMLETIDSNPNFMHNIMFTDEAASTDVTAGYGVAKNHTLHTSLSVIRQS
jgi:hypothetical protein